jgi:serine/threonine-protein kinase
VVPELGEILGGKYRILRVLGEGGMGAVYEAENVLTLKRAAIKRLHAQLLAHDEGYQRVLHEARACARIRHRNVVDVYDVVSEGDAICLVMELLIGEPLSALIARGGLAVHDYVNLLLPAMEGVAAAHAVGVVHRDIKPENIFLVNEPGLSEPVPKVIDFGISKVTDPGDAPNLTRSGITMGTPRYVSYEQLVGAKNVDERADVYSFGVMLYEALTGRAPYNANTFGQQAICFATTVPMRPRAARSDVPEELDALVWRAIARNRDERFASMKEFMAALAPFARAATYAEPIEAFPQVSMDPLLAGAPFLTTTPGQATPLPAGGWHETPHPAVSAPLPLPSPQHPPRTARLWWMGLLIGMLLAVLVALNTRRASVASEQAPVPAPEVSLTAPQSEVPAAKAQANPPKVDEVAQKPYVPEAPSAAAVAGEPKHRVTHGASADGASRAERRPAGHAKSRAERPSTVATPAIPAAAPEQAPPEQVPAASRPDGIHRAGRVRRDQF